MALVNTRVIGWTLAVLTLQACGSGLEDTESEVSGLAPGLDATVVSDTFPLSFAPGERVNVSFTVDNDGTMTDGTNDWDRDFVLYRQNSGWGWVFDRVIGTVVPGDSETFQFVVTAPTTPGTYNFGVRMRELGDTFFGSGRTVTGISVDAANTPRWECTEVTPGTFGTTFTPGETRSETIEVENTGTETWPASGLCLRATDSPTSFWGGNTCISLTSSVAPGGTATFTTSYTAPSTPGTYTFTRQMLDTRSTGVGFFSTVSDCVNRTITVSGSSILDASFTSTTIPSPVAPGDQFNISLTVQNDGTQDWNTSDFLLTHPNSRWGVTTVTLSSSVAAGNSTTFSFNVTSSTTAGTYDMEWQMRKTSGSNQSLFGEKLAFPVVVDASLTTSFDASATTVVPARMTAGEAAQFTISMENTGTDDWVSSDFALVAVHFPASLWGVTISPLGASETVTAGSTRDFVLNVTAPSSPGTYDAEWRMRETGGRGPFGEIASDSIEVTNCGNDIIDAGEACDDGNLNSDDGCSDTCTVETRTVDLSAASADRTIFGSTFNKNLGNVAAGDVDADGFVDLIVGENSHARPGSGPFRNQSGRIFVYSGGGGFFSVADQTVPTGSSKELLGADPGDSLGLVGSAGIGVGEVSGDASNDFMVSAIRTQGTGNVGTRRGTIYLLQGGPTLTSTTVVDLNLGVSQPLIFAVIEGGADSDQLRGLAIGRDLTGDGVGDVVAGSPSANELYIIPGGGTLTGTISLGSPPSSVRTISAPGASAACGVGASIADINDDGNDDLLFGCPSHTDGGRSRTGFAAVIFGPISGDVDASLAVGSSGAHDVEIIGETANDKLGLVVDGGNVVGSAEADLVVSAPQARQLPGQVGGVYIFEGPLSSGTSIDLSSTPDAADATIFGADQYDNLGSSLALFDYNGNGFLDLLVGAGAADGPSNARNGAGEAFVYAGQESGPSVYPLLEVFGVEARDLLGYQPNTIVGGDFDGDGLGDACFGSYRGEEGAVEATGRMDCFEFSPGS